MKNENLDSYVSAYTEAFAYHRDEILLLRAYAGQLLSQLHGKRPRRILSLGIGGQLISKSLFTAFADAEYHLVEGSQEIIARYRREVMPPASVQIHHAYFEEIDFPAGHFDVIEMGFVLEHVDDPMLVLKRFLPALAVDGLLFAAVPNARSLHRLFGHAAGLMDDLYSLSEADRALGHKRYFDAASIADLVDQAGYLVRSQHGLVMKPLTTSQLEQLNLDSRIEQAFIDVGYAQPDLANGVLIVATHA